jgi:hypothetical protein
MLCVATHQIRICILFCCFPTYKNMFLLHLYLLSNHVVVYYNIDKEEKKNGRFHLLHPKNFVASKESTFVLPMSNDRCHLEPKDKNLSVPKGMNTTDRIICSREMVCVTRLSWHLRVHIVLVQHRTKIASLFYVSQCIFTDIKPSVIGLLSQTIGWRLQPHKRLSA